MKAVVLARGKGTRMQRAATGAVVGAAQAEAADRGIKGMIPFRRPFLDYVISALADAGCTDVCLVIGPEHDVVREHYAQTQPVRVRLSFAVQDQPKGTADAVLSARGFAGLDPFLVLNSDNYYPIDVLAALVALGEPGLPAFGRTALIAGSNIDPDRIRTYAMLTIDAGGYLADIVEKPDARTFEVIDRTVAGGGDVRVSMNCWRFDTTIFDACAAIEPSPRGEIELPNAVRHAIRAMGARFKTIPVDAGVLDLSRRDDIAEVERRLAHVDPRL